jgi:hypothetical protein
MLVIAVSVGDLRFRDIAFPWDVRPPIAKGNRIIQGVSDDHDILQGEENEGRDFLQAGLEAWQSWDGPEFAKASHQLIKRNIGPDFNAKLWLSIWK